MNKDIYIDKLKVILKNFPLFAVKLLKIQTKEKQLVPFKLRKGQTRIWKAVEKCIKENKPIRIIILKARQIGSSTFCEALVFWFTVTIPNTRTLIIADEQIRAEALFRISKLFYEHLDDDIEGFKPTVSTDNKKMMIFDKMGSQFVIEMATKIKGGRTYTIHNIHSSETAFYPRAEELFTATLPSVPIAPNTCIILESTSAGYGGYFHNEWKRAVKGESDFIPIFIAWYDWEDYELIPPDNMRRTNGEIKLQEKVREFSGVELTKKQLYWRRVMVRNMGRDGEQTFQREFPSTPDEAFLAESTLYFPAEVLELTTTQEPKKGILYKAYTHIKPVYKFKEDPRESLKVWYEPEKDDKGNPINRYVVGVDTASGTAEDFSVVEILDKKNMRQCAEYRNNRVHSDQLATIVEDLARWYNDALIGIEINRGEGLAVQDRLMESYGNIYYREQYDTGLRTYTTKPGWVTTTKSRPIMLSRLREVIREGLFEINSLQLLDELKSFRVIDGKPQAPGSEHDDCIIAMGIAMQLYDYIPDDIYKQKIPEFWREHIDEKSPTGYM